MRPLLEVETCLISLSPAHSALDTLVSLTLDLATLTFPLGFLFDLLLTPDINMDRSLAASQSRLTFQPGRLLVT